MDKQIQMNRFWALAEDALNLKRDVAFQELLAKGSDEARGKIVELNLQMNKLRTSLRDVHGIGVPASNDIAQDIIDEARRSESLRQRQQLARTLYVIRSLSEGECDLDGNSGAFWSNENGWDSLESATRFSTQERMDRFLPISSGGDSEWMLLEEALDLVSKTDVRRNLISVARETLDRITGWGGSVHLSHLAELRSAVVAAETTGYGDDDSLIDNVAQTGAELVAKFETWGSGSIHASNFAALKKAIASFKDVHKKPGFIAGQMAVFNSSDANGLRDVAVEIVRPLTAGEADLHDVGAMYKVRFADGLLQDVFADELTALPESGRMSGTLGKHDWCIGKCCESGYPVFVDDKQLSYRKTVELARDYALEIIARLHADGDYRLNDRPNGFLPPELSDEKPENHAEKSWKAVAEALFGAVDSLETQVNQMKGMFPDDDGLIQEALDEADEATKLYIRASRQTKMPTRAQTDSKWYFGKLKEQHGEQQYTHTLLLQTAGDPDQFLDAIAARYYDDAGAPEDGGYWHMNGTLFVATGGTTLLEETVAEAMAAHIPVHRTAK